MIRSSTRLSPARNASVTTLTDNCGDMLDSYAARYPFITHHAKKIKVCTHNVGIRLAKVSLSHSLTPMTTSNTTTSAPDGGYEQRTGRSHHQQLFFEFQSGQSSVPAPDAPRSSKWRKRLKIARPSFPFRHSA